MKNIICKIKESWSFIVKDTEKSKTSYSFLFLSIGIVIILSICLVTFKPYPMPFSWCLICICILMILYIFAATLRKNRRTKGTFVFFNVISHVTGIIFFPFIVIYLCIYNVSEKLDFDVLLTRIPITLTLIMEFLLCMTIWFGVIGNWLLDLLQILFNKIDIFRIEVDTVYFIMIFFGLLFCNYLIKLTINITNNYLYSLHKSDNARYINQWDVLKFRVLVILMFILYILKLPKTYQDMREPFIYAATLFTLTYTIKCIRDSKGK